VELEPRSLAMIGTAQAAQLPSRFVFEFQDGVLLRGIRRWTFHRPEHEIILA
jgi:hypothetical protein